jgi:hypothetical protein
MLRIEDEYKSAENIKIYLLVELAKNQGGESGVIRLSCYHVTLPFSQTRTTIVWR